MKIAEVKRLSLFTSIHSSEAIAVNSLVYILPDFFYSYINIHRDDFPPKMGFYVFSFGHLIVYHGHLFKV